MDSNGEWLLGYGGFLSIDVSAGKWAISTQEDNTFLVVVFAGIIGGSIWIVLSSHEFMSHQILKSSVHEPSLAPAILFFS